MKQDIKDLIKKYLEVVNSQKNQSNKNYWKNVYGWNRDMWRGVPKNKIEGNIPFTIAPDNSFWSRLLKVDLRDYYNNPETYLETQLRMKLYSFNNFKDNTYFTNELFIWFGVITELSYFGSKINFFANKEAWLKEALIKEYIDLDKIKIPDFYKSGLMPRIHRFYEVLQEYADGNLKVMFPEWVRGPFCIAAHLRGLENILMDFILNPGFVHKLMRFIVESSKQWNKERNKFLGNEIKTIKLYNDEIGKPMISPAIYKEFIFPYEKELSDYYGEVLYWHSCGVTDDVMEQINQLNNLKMFHCGPWTSYQKAAEIFRDITPLDICLDPQEDIIEADQEKMTNKLMDIMEKCKNSKYTIRADGFMPQGEDIVFMLEKIKQWNEVALKVLNAG
jgi:hypothetical protein